MTRGVVDGEMQKEKTNIMNRKSLAGLVGLVALTVGVCLGVLPAPAADLTANKGVLERPNAAFSYMQVTSGTVIYAGALVAVDTNTGYAVNAADTEGLRVIGVAQAQVDQRIYDSTKRLLVKRGVFCFANPGSFTTAAVGDWAYVLDNQSVVPIASATNDILAGRIVEVDTRGVWVNVTEAPIPAPLTITTLAASGNATVGGTLEVTGAATLSAGAGIAGLTTVSNLTATGTITLPSGSVANAALASPGVGTYTNAQTTFTNVYDAAGRLVSHTP